MTGRGPAPDRATAAHEATASHGAVLRRSTDAPPGRSAPVWREPVSGAVPGSGEPLPVSGPVPGSGEPALMSRAVPGSGEPLPAFAATSRSSEERRRIPDRRRDGARLAALEADRWRSFEDAQREADTMFAQYQLSQLLASGGSVAELSAAVLDELLRHDEAQAGALWLTPPGGGLLTMVAVVPGPGAAVSGPGVSSSGPGASGPRAPSAAVPETGKAEVPRQLEDVAAATSWCRGAGWAGVPLEESRDTGDGFEQRTVGFVALQRDAAHDRSVPLRFLPRVRHELAIAFRAAQLRETLAHERSLLAAILDGATDAIVAVDEKRRVVRLNRAALALLDASPETAPTPCHELLGCDRPRPNGANPQLRCGTRCPFEEVLAGAPPIVGREQTVMGRNGEEIPVVASYAPMSGSDAGAVAVLHDLRGARALDELRSSFVAAVSHDLRTPLALITAYVDTLLGLELDAPQRRRAIEGIGKAAARLAALVDEILDVAHLESNRIALRRQPTSLAAIVSRVTAEFADAPGIPPIEVALPADLPPVDVDADRIAQVLDNLVTNAAKYGGTSAPITIRAAQQERYVVVSVEDEGVGIAPAERDQVFERFYRGRRAREASVPGSGLGLYVCRRLVEAHGGEIWVDDRPHGTAIAFTLPVAVSSRSRRSRGTVWTVGTP